MGKNRLEMRRMAEAAEKIKKTAGEDDGKKGKKKAKAAPKAKRKTAARKGKDRAHQRKRMVWCVFNGSMKEEGRFPYDKKADAEAKLELLRSKSKKLYFLQAVKEVIGESAVPVSDIIPADEDLDEIPERSDDEEEDEDVEVDLDAEAMDEDDDDMGEEEVEDDED
jgi:hypothetical protein